MKKGIYPYEYMDDWEKFNQKRRITWKKLPEKEEFYININLGDIIDADYMHTKRVCKDFEKKIRWISWFVS